MGHSNLTTLISAHRKVWKGETSTVHTRSFSLSDSAYLLPRHDLRAIAHETIRNKERFTSRTAHLEDVDAITAAVPTQYESPTQKLVEQSDETAGYS